MTETPTPNLRLLATQNPCPTSDQALNGSSYNLDVMPDLEREVTQAMGDTAGTWRFVERFAADLGRPVADGDGFVEAELNAAEARLGVSMPPALRELYRRIGRRDDLVRVQDLLLTPKQLHLDDTGAILVFRVEHQHATRWGVPVATAVPDPPVYFQVGLEWRLFLGHLSHAVVEMLLSEWMLAEGEFTGNRELDRYAISLVEQHFRRLPLPDYPLWPDPDGPPTRWFHGHGHGAVLRCDGEEWLWARATSAEALDSGILASQGRSEDPQGRSG